MKKYLAIILAILMVLGLFAGCSSSEKKTPDPAPAATDAAPAATDAAPAAPVDEMEELIAAAKAEGKLVVYGSCEEEYLAAACEKFQELYGIET